MCIVCIGPEHRDDKINILELLLDSRNSRFGICAVFGPNDNHTVGPSLTLHTVYYVPRKIGCDCNLSSTVPKLTQKYVLCIGGRPAR